MTTTYGKKADEKAERLRYKFDVPAAGFGDEKQQIANLADSYFKDTGKAMYMHVDDRLHRVLNASMPENYDGLAGKRVTFTVKAEPEGKKLAQRVLQELKKIVSKTG
jgi:hypothetical protein